jgi:fructosamine-3-kinase
LGLLTTDLVSEILDETGIALDVKSSRRLGGGDIAQTCVCEDEQHRKYVLKMTSSSPGIGDSEASGLAALEAASPSGLHIPHVYGSGRFNGSEWVLIAYVDTGSSRRGSYLDFGRQLARLHLREDETRYGFERDTYLGYSLQDNRWNDSFISLTLSMNISWSLNIRVSSMGICGAVTTCSLPKESRFSSILPSITATGRQILP